MNKDDMKNNEEIDIETCISEELDVKIKDLDEVISNNKIDLNWSDVLSEDNICDDAIIKSYVGHLDNTSYAILKFVVYRDSSLRDIVSRRAHLLGSFKTYSEFRLNSLLNMLQYDISEIYEVNKISNNEIELIFIINPSDYVESARKDFMECYNVFMNDVIRAMKIGETVEVPDKIINLIGKSIAITGQKGINLFTTRDELIDKSCDMINDIWDKDEED